MAQMLLSLELQRVINRASAVLDRSKWTELGVRPPSLHVVWAWDRILVRISHRLQMRAF
jgi:hypothetical protein